jgi:hypothetical protein
MPRFNDIPEIEENLDGKGLRVVIAACCRPAAPNCASLAWHRPTR